MGTEAQAREWRKWLGKELYASQLAEHRRNLDTIATDIKEERKARKKSLREAKATCKASFAALKDRAREAVTNARTVAIEARREEKQAQREQCKLDRDHIKANIKANLQELAKNRQALHAAKSECKARAVAVKQRADEAHAKAIALEADAQRAKKRAHLDRCKLDREHIKTEAAAKIAANEKKAGELKRFRAEIERLTRTKRAESPARTRRAESDDEVRQNIDSGYVPLFERIKRTIKADPRKSRTEAFLEYVEAHPQEAIEAQESYAIKQLQADERRQNRERRAEAAAAVPF